MGRRQTASAVLASTCAIALAVFLWPWGPSTAVPKAAPARAASVLISSVKIPGKALSAPTVIAVAGGRVWVANSRYQKTGSAGGWITELSAKTGALVRVISARPDRLTDPEAITADGTRVWVVNTFGDSVTELDARTGALIRVISAQRYQLNEPGAVTADGSRVWVANAGDDSIIELSARTGALIRVISGKRYQLNSGGFTVAIAAARNSVWVPNANGNSVTEINATTGALIRVITSLPNFSFATTPGGDCVWFVTNAGVKGVGDSGPEGSVAELGATSGQLLHNIAVAPFAASNPGGAITAAGTHVWVAGRSFYSARGWVAELSAATGTLIRVISS